MRGKGFLYSLSTYRPGITPAYAGKRSKCLSGYPKVWDHPRVCGEKYLVEENGFAIMGSPPRMRGKVVQPALPALESGITPAYAGKSPTHQMSWKSVWDHPRVCGEKLKSMDQNAVSLGSPPRMRGKAKIKVDYTGRRGITPAYAGKSNIKRGIHHISWDHPRVCGEKAQKALKYKRSFFFALKFPLTSDKSLMSIRNLS